MCTMPVPSVRVTSVSYTHLAGRVGRFIAQVADIIHAVVGGGVYFRHVHDAAVVDALADVTFAAWVCPVAVRAIDSLGKYLGAGGFARAARTGEQIGMAYFAMDDLVLQRGSDARLTHNIGKRFGPPFAVQRTVHRGTLPFMMAIKSGQGHRRIRKRPVCCLACRGQETCGAQSIPLNAARFPA